jgi:hypothetical protein
MNDKNLGPLAPWRVLGREIAARMSRRGKIAALWKPRKRTYE